jgi:hypothetical protein
MIHRGAIAVKTAVVKVACVGLVRMMVPAAVAAATTVGSVSIALVAEATVVYVSLALLTHVVAALEVALVPVVQVVVPLFPLRLVDEFLGEVVLSMLGIPAVVAVAVVTQDTVQVGIVAVVAGITKTQSVRG